MAHLSATESHHDAQLNEIGFFYTGEYAKGTQQFLCFFHLLENTRFSSVSRISHVPSKT